MKRWINKGYLLSLWMIFMLTSSVFAQTTFEMGTARALGMGNAYIGVAEAPDAAFYNPAGLVRNKDVPKYIQVGWDQLQYDWKNETTDQEERFQKTGGLFGVIEYSGVLGGSYYEIEHRPPPQYNAEEQWHLNQKKVILTSAEPTSSQLLVGIQGVYIHLDSDEWDISHQHIFGMDLSFLYTPHSYFQLGVTTHNLLKTKTNEVYFDNFGHGILIDQKPRDFSLGVCFRGSNFLIIAADVHHVLERKMECELPYEITIHRSYHLGAEINIANMILLRSGIFRRYLITNFYEDVDEDDFNYTTINRLSFGFGFWYRNAMLDGAIIFDDRQEEMRQFKNIDMDEKSPFEILVSFTWKL